MDLFPGQSRISRSRSPAQVDKNKVLTDNELMFYINIV